MINLKLVLILLGVILCALAAFGVPSSRISLGWLGIALFGLAWVV